MAVSNSPFQSVAEATEDYRWAGPTSECMCGGTMFLLMVAFDPEERLPGFYITDAMCMKCKALVRVPTPVDDLPAPDKGQGPLTCPDCGSDEDVVVKNNIARCFRIGCDSQWATGGVK